MVKNKIIVKAVIGANYGDEGKGQMVDYYCHQAALNELKCLNVCTNGGAQRGHTVELSDGTKHVFSHFGSGTFSGADTYLPVTFILNPILFGNEYGILMKSNTIHKIFVHPDCMWSTPYDMILNQLKEELRGENKHGSCGVGIWETIKRYNKMEHISIKEFYEFSTLKQIEYLDKIKLYLYNNVFEYSKKDIPEHWIKIIESNDLKKNFIADFNFMYERVIKMEEKILNQYDYIVFENGQGLLLDMNQVPIEHTTPSNTGIKDIKEILKNIEKEYCFECCYVTRTYLTRHGAGPFPTECSKNEINTEITDLTNKENIHQGKLRYGKLSIEELKERIFADFDGVDNGEISLAVTHLNETEGRFADESKTHVDSLRSIFTNIYKSDGKTRESIFRISKKEVM